MATTVRPSDSIDVLDLPMRSYNALARNNVRTVEGLTELDEAHFLRFRNVGAATLEELKRHLATFGLAMRIAPPPPPDPSEVERAAWVGRQIGALVKDDRVYARNWLGTRCVGDEIYQRRRAWAWYRWGTTPDAHWPRDKAGGFGFMAAPLPGSLELHLEGLNRLAHQELGS